MNGLIARIEAIYGDHRAQEWDVGSKVQRTFERKRRAAKFVGHHNLLESILCYVYI